MKYQRFEDGKLVEFSINGIQQPLSAVITEQIDPNKWPIWAKALKLLATSQDNGVGDVIARVIGPENSATFEAWHVKTFGKKCNCKGRHIRWNKLYPLSVNPRPQPLPRPAQPQPVKP
jgi:hypothetical protein